MQFIENGMIDTPVYSGPDRRKNCDRRVRVDQRKNIRFDENGGDRRSGNARRATDEGFMDIDFE